ncbi:DNA-3-methyladenine glycosylase 2 family protein [Aureimonas fodinaquatilis]|uniref:DNA-3-methyladenine glycosylase II n=1 Tax=Aureimonas fodinaquatilis TaxID=2565783 RepID=A0A5B0DY04_9HYPH|nr:DNA-3-methyladenine glycosylase [Aureimonas fodinaquatilis]KAA0971654.1 DNA-3-methyladenine glycosylase 2 family protein [Aureimonas fodinaquatilis]
MISSLSDIETGLNSLADADPRLRAVIHMAGPLPLRRNDGGLPGLASTIIAQQVSKASADAIFGRFSQAVDLNNAQAILGTPDEVFRMAGLSRGKQRTMLAIASAVDSGALDFQRVATAQAAEAIAELTSVHGIGVWTAECYCLFSLGHDDIFPAGDLALQVAVAHALELPQRPVDKVLRQTAQLWAPHRSVAARLFWAYYAAITKRDAAPTVDATPGHTAE